MIYGMLFSTSRRSHNRWSLSASSKPPVVPFTTGWRTGTDKAGWMFVVVCLGGLLAAGCGAQPVKHKPVPPAPVATASPSVSSAAAIATATAAVEQAWHPAGKVSYSAKLFPYSQVSSDFHPASGAPVPTQVWVVVATGKFSPPPPGPTPSATAGASSGNTPPPVPTSISSLAFFVSASSGQILAADFPAPPGL